MSEDSHVRTKQKCENLRNEQIDLLSNLPDSILLQILSKLQTKDAVAASLLSSRYKSLWMNLNSIKFNNWFCRDYTKIDEERQMFAHFVNRVFILLKSKSIHKFCLRLDGLYPVYNVSTWFTAAIVRNLKVLKFVSEEDYCVHSRRFVVMPSCFYKCETLEFLELRNNLHLDVPESVCFPKLKVIELEHVRFSSDGSVGRLISGCPLLEYLGIDRDEFDNVRTFTIDSPTLKSLNYSFHSEKGLVEHEFKLVLNTPKLTYLQLRDNASRDFVVDSLCPLENADFYIESPRELNNIDSHYERVVKLLQRFDIVNHLWIAGNTLEALSHVPQVRRYRYLRHSVLCLGQNNFEWTLQDFLEGSDKSHKFYLSTHVMHWREPGELPICLLSCLKTISVSGFRGRDSELNMIAYILKNAKVLKKMTISKSVSEAETNFELLEKILQFDKGSGRCDITLS